MHISGLGVTVNEPSKRKRIGQASTVNVSSGIITSTRPHRYPVANALWPRLVAAERGEHVWIVNTAPMHAWQSGSGAPLITTTPAAPVSESQSRHEITEHYLLAYAPRTTTKLNRGIRVKLHKEVHDAILHRLEPAERWHYTRALRAATCTRPFYTAPERPSGWRRNPNEELITETCAAILEQLAVGCVLFVES